MVMLETNSTNKLPRDFLDDLAGIRFLEINKINKIISFNKQTINQTIIKETRRKETKNFTSNYKKRRAKTLHLPIVST